jgi:hypothetical protein
MKNIIKSTKDLINFFPELNYTDKYKKKINEVLKTGRFQFEVETKEVLKCFESKRGLQYKSRISYNSNAFLFKITEIVNGSVTMGDYNDCPEKFISIETVSNGYNKIGNDTYLTYQAKYEHVENTTWFELAKLIGKLIKNDLVEVCSCTRCNGTGLIPQFKHYNDGICFECLGIGKWFEPKK